MFKLTPEPPPTIRGARKHSTMERLRKTLQMAKQWFAFEFHGCQQHPYRAARQVGVTICTSKLPSGGIRVQKLSR